MNKQPPVLLPGDPHTVALSGGKAHALWLLWKEGFCIPSWFVITPHAFENGKLGPEAVRQLEHCLDALSLRAKPLAVRSSSVEEDSAASSFAGQFESYLGISVGNLREAVQNVWNSGYKNRVAQYKTARGEQEGFRPPAVLVQEMVSADSAGVAFSVDPVTGNWEHAILSALPGLGSTLVDGVSDADSFVIDREEQVVGRTVAHKSKARFLTVENGYRIEERTLDPAASAQASITEGQAIRIAGLARDCERFFGRPQDIEWALQDDTLFLLQSRPVTTLSNSVDPAGRMLLWDNSNIAESYSGITLPLTFSFARYIYTEVYRQFCILLKVSPERISLNVQIFGQMLGLIRGRVYYNLLSWYKVLALLPGYSLNKGFMEQMMGVKQAISVEAQREVDTVKGNSKWADGLNLAISLVGLVHKHFTMEKDVKRFYLRLDHALTRQAKPFETMRIGELSEHFHKLERELLTQWDAPLVNDFIAMIFFGLLRRCCQKWIADGGDFLHNELLCEMGDIISAEPARRLRTMAAMAVEDSDLIDSLRSENKARILESLSGNPTLLAETNRYFEIFGDRCLDELKLESATLIDDPMPLYRSVGELAARMRETQSNGIEQKLPGIFRQSSAEDKARTALKGSWGKRVLFNYVLKHARRRIQGRENLRFERTRLFGQIRRLFLEIGKRLYAFNRLDHYQDIFYLELHEIIRYIEGMATTQDLRSLVALRKKEYETFAAEEPPADRFETRGAVPIANRFRPEHTKAPFDNTSGLRGIACCPGVVRGKARVVSDPQIARLQRGEILVARQTDPGWILLFPLASGLLVERGSMLSHSAIVSRELGLPSIVSIQGLMETIQTGDEIEMDGSTGDIRILAKTASGGNPGDAATEGKSD